METTKYAKSWLDRVQPFADGVGKTVGEVTDALREAVGVITEDEKVAAGALEVLSNKEAISDTELKESLKALGIPFGIVNLHLSKLRGEPAKVEAPAISSSTALSALAILPAVPDEASFLEMLKTGGILKVESTEVISAVKAAFARRVNLYDLPEKILKKMETFAIAQEEPCGEGFFKLQKLLTQKKYGEVLSVLGVDGSYVSETRKKDFFTRIDAKLWPSLDSFQIQLKQWQDTWLQGVSNPAAMMLAISVGPRSGGAIPPGIMEAPDTSPLRAAAEEVINDINRIFAGPGIPVARALAYDATRIMGILSDSSLPQQTGSATKEQMLKDLGINVGADMVRTEQSITRYTLAVMSLPKVAADSEVAYLSALITLGNSINWKSFGMKGAGIGGNL